MEGNCVTALGSRSSPVSDEVGLPRSDFGGLLRLWILRWAQNDMGGRPVGRTGFPLSRE